MLCRLRQLISSSWVFTPTGGSVAPLVKRLARQPSCPNWIEIRCVVPSTAKRGLSRAFVADTGGYALTRVSDVHFSSAHGLSGDAHE